MVVINTSVTLAGRYRLDGRIAFGGVGEVWRAVDLVLGRPVAVKLLRAEYAEHPEVLTRFRAEARHAGSVSHPGIAQVYDFGETGAADSPYLVMELVDGPSLARVLAAGPLNPADTMDVLAQAAAGLQAAHAAGLVHRDIKPGNLLVGPVGQVKITDFGIAYAAWSAPITQTGALVGTPAYLAPGTGRGRPGHPGQRSVRPGRRRLPVPDRRGPVRRDAARGGGRASATHAATTAPGRARRGGQADPRAHRQGSGGPARQRG